MKRLHHPCFFKQCAQALFDLNGWLGRRAVRPLVKEVTASSNFESKTDAEKAASTIREAILAGTFERAADRLAREQREAEKRAAAGLAADAIPAEPTIEAIGLTYFADHLNPKTGERLSKSERFRWDFVMRTVIQRPSGDTVRFGALPLAAIRRHDVDAFSEAAS
jgi:hypothetical protein